MPTARSIVIVANPTSGRGRGRRTADKVAANLRARGLSVDVRHTTRPGDAERLALEAIRNKECPCDCIVACGGDGTVQEVANALASERALPEDKRPALGLAPAGRCNDFARVLRVPKDPAGIAEILARGKPRAIDLGRVNDRYFCTVATVGVDAEVSRYVDSMRVPLTGTLAYLYGALCVLCRYRPRVLRITGDFGVIERPLFLASSANTSSYGGAIKISPRAVPTDGQLDLCVIDAVSRLRALTLVPQVLAGRHETLPEVRFIRARQVRIDADEPLEIWADGERIACTPATIQAVPDAIRVLLRHGINSAASAGGHPALPADPYRDREGAATE
jgi:diacylglycerol kinase (ATP)